MKQTTLCWILSASLFTVENTQALDLTYAKGTFDTSFGLHQMMDFDVALDVNVLHAGELHLPVYGNWYLFGSIDLYQSDTLDDYASYPDRLLDTSFFGLSPSDTAASAGAPVPVSFKMHGIDASLGIGYAVWAKERNFLGIGLQTGLSMPYMQTRNLVKTAEQFVHMLETTKTDITTYKLMPAVSGRYAFSRLFSVEGSWAFGYQYGSIANDYLKSKADFRGTVMQSDIALRLTPWQPAGLSFLAGFRLGDWNVDTMDVTLAETVAHNYSDTFDLGFSSQMFYVGAGWSF